MKHIVVDVPPRAPLVDLVLERLPVEAGELGLVQRQVEREAHPRLDLFRRRRDRFGREQVEHAQLVVCAEEPPRVAWRALGVQRQRVEVGDLGEGCVGEWHSGGGDWLSRTFTKNGGSSSALNVAVVVCLFSGVFSCVER